MSDDQQILIRLRAVMARELETINEYEQYAAATADPEIKALFQHLADEEKEHVTEVYEVLKQRDAVQAAWEQGAHVQAIREGAFGDAIAAGMPKHSHGQEAEEIAPPPAPVSLPAPEPLATPSPQTVRPVPTITVGNLFGMPQG
jgi:rubrerythrin